MRTRFGLSLAMSSLLLGGAAFGATAASTRRATPGVKATTTKVTRAVRAQPDKLKKAPPAKAASYVEHLLGVNPKLARIMKDNPGVERFLEKAAADGAVFDGKLGVGER